jgi:general stress protein YciG
MSDSSKLPTEVVPPPQNISSITTYLAQIGRKGGLKGGPARAKKLSKKELREIGKKGANARWGTKATGTNR